MNFRTISAIILLIFFLITSFKLIDSKKNFSFALFSIVNIFPFLIRFWASGVEDNLVLFDQSSYPNFSTIIFSFDLLCRLFFILIFYFSEFNQTGKFFNNILKFKVSRSYIIKLRKLRIYSIFVSISSCLIAFAISGIEFLAINRLEILTSVNPVYKIIMPLNWCSVVMWGISLSLILYRDLIENKEKSLSILKLIKVNYCIEGLIILLSIMLFNQRGIILNLLVPFFASLTLLPSFREAIKKFINYRIKTQYLLFPIVILIMLTFIIKARDFTNYGLTILGLEQESNVEEILENDPLKVSKNELSFTEKIIDSPDASYIDTWTVVNNHEDQASFTLNCSFLRFLPNSLRLNKFKCYTALDRINSTVNPFYIDTYIGFNIWFTQELYWNFGSFGIFGIVLAHFISGLMIVIASNSFLNLIKGNFSFFSLGLVLIFIQTNGLTTDLGGTIQWTGFIILYLSLFYLLSPLIKTVKI